MLDQLAMLGMAADVSLDPMIVIDAENLIVYCNDATGKLFGYTRSELIGSSLLALLPPEAHEGHRRGVARYVQNKGTARSTVGYVEVYGVHRSGAQLPFSLSMTYGELNGEPFISGVLRDMREIKMSQDLLAQKVLDLQRLTRELTFLSERDHLTGAYNRRHLNAFAETQYPEAQKRNDYMSVILCDIDYFKVYNDLCGHLAGDTCLRTVAETIVSTVGDQGSTYRYGGEEFLIALPAIEPTDAAAVGETLRRAVHERKIEHPSPNAFGFVSISVGGVTTRSADRAFSALMNDADEALYRAKKVRNAVEWKLPPPN